MTGTTWRLPAEWEPQAAILLAWPHPGTDWAGQLPQVEDTYLALLAAITRFEPALVIVADAALESRVRGLLTAAAISGSRVRFVHADYEDTWLRDSGPITLVAADQFRLNDFRFTGWGGKFSASRDDRLVGALFARALFRHSEHHAIEFALEGGAIDSDGAGSVLTTYRCLRQRHPTLDRPALQQALAGFLAAARVLILESGELQGDDTDAHIDTLARFAARDAIVFQACTDQRDCHFAPLQAMQAELAALRTQAGAPYRLHALPWPQPIHAADGRRLAASYANFLIVNGAVLLPTYADPADVLAAQVLASAFPDRQIEPVPARALIEQNGSLHCLTMQLPLGVLHE
jgi:agmatine/peptidylarginine deiminase